MVETGCGIIPRGAAGAAVRSESVASNGESADAPVVRGGESVSIAIRLINGKAIYPANVRRVIPTGAPNERRSPAKLRDIGSRVTGGVAAFHRVRVSRV